jgi:hypothetical protein
MGAGQKCNWGRGSTVPVCKYHDASSQDPSGSTPHTPMGTHTRLRALPLRFNAKWRHKRKEEGKVRRTALRPSHWKRRSESKGCFRTCKTKKVPLPVHIPKAGFSCQQPKHLPSARREEGEPKSGFPTHCPPRPGPEPRTRPPSASI